MDNKSPGSRSLARANSLEAKPASHHIRPRPQAHTLFAPMYFDPAPPVASPSHSAATRVGAGGSQGLGFRSHSTKLERRNFPVSRHGAQATTAPAEDSPSLLPLLDQGHGSVIRDGKFVVPDSAKSEDVVNSELNKKLVKIYNITADLKNLMQECTNVSGEQRDFYHGYAVGELNKEASYSHTIVSKVRKYLNDMDAGAVNEPMEWDRSKAVSEQMRWNRPQLLN